MDATDTWVEVPVASRLHVARPGTFERALAILPAALGIAVPGFCVALLVAWAFVDRWALVGIGVVAVGLLVLLATTLGVAAAHGDRRMAERFGAPEPWPIGLVVPLLALQVEDAVNRPDFPAGTEEARLRLRDALAQLDAAAEVLAQSRTSAPHHTRRSATTD